MSDVDPKGLIREAYRIEGIGAEECRAIFLDWALSVPVNVETRDLIETLLARHATAETESHPMTEVLRAGLAAAQQPKRRGGWRGRRS
jgi:hypothetical protein